MVEGPGTEKLLGSGATCHLRLPLGNVDANHARMAWTDAGVLLTDEGSATGTYVNGERIEADHPLQDGDRIFLGTPGSPDSAKLLVRIPASAGVAAAGSFTAGEAPELDLGSDDPILLAPSAPAPNEPLVLEPEPAPAAPAPAKPAPAAPATAAKPTDTKSPAAPTAPPAPPPPPRKAERADYQTEAPSIGGDRPRVAVDLPPADVPKKPGTRKPGAKPGVPRAALLGGGALVVGLGAYFGMQAYMANPPIITSVIPAKAEAGQTVTVNGTGFATSATGNVVRFGKEAGTVTAATETSLAVTVPTVLTSGSSASVPVSVQTGHKKSNTLMFKAYAAPHVTALNPDVAMPGEEIVVVGQNLKDKILVVTAAGQPVEVLDAQPTALRIRVPALPLGKNVLIAVQVAGESAKPATLILGRLPLVTDISPSRGMAGERVLIKGRGFDPNAKGNTVSFGGQPALILGASASEIVVVVPPASGMESPAAAPVIIHALGKESAPTATFTTTRLSTSQFTPRYFAAMVAEHPTHDHAFVSTDLGPVLLLTGGVPSVSERAVKVAAALNAVVLAAGSKPLVLEAREKPEAGVGVEGLSELLVTVSAADAAGFEEAWEGATKGKRATPAAVAQYWAAVLQDHLSLFVQRHRPFHLLEISPRGRLLSDLYSEAARRSGEGTGVAAALIWPVPPATARAFREAAVSLPADGWNPGAAVEGGWWGNFDQHGANRELSVRLKVAGAQVTGSATMKSSGVAMQVPLQDVGYNKGTLRFVLPLGGSPETFEGTMQGETITGTVSAGKQATGRFTLRYQ